MAGGDEEELACFFNLESPNTPHIGVVDLVKAGLLRMPFLFGWSATKRLLEVKDWYERKHDAVKAAAFPGREAEVYYLQR